MAKQQKPAWVYLSAGLIIGLFVAGLVYLSQQDGSGIDFKVATEREAQRIKDAREVKEDKPSPPSKPDLSFYDMLPELEVSVSPDLDLQIAPKQQPVQQTPKSIEKPATSTPVHPAAELYYLQVGAFSKSDSADRQKAQLTLKNWPTRVQQVRRDNGSRLYRVYVGPYNNDTELRRAETGLKKQGLKPVRQKAS